MKTIFSLVTILIILSIPGLGQITSVQSGPWTDETTWVGGVIPTSNDDAQIGSGHIISVDDTNAVCKSLSFADTSGHIDMNADSRLSLFGDFAIFDETHNVFSGGWSGTNAEVRFTGEAIQVIKNFKHLGASTSFRDLVIDKTAGMVITDTTKFQTIGIQNSFKIVRGEFVLSSQDDLEGRFAVSANLGATPTITIHPEGVFRMVGSSSHIRKNTSNEPIGKMIVYGEATVTSSSTNRINLAGIDIEEGGTLFITTGWSTSTKTFNPGVIVIKDGGRIRNTTTTNCWVDTTIVELQTGGAYETTSSTTIFPPNFINNGTVRYARNSTTPDQVITDMNYHRLEISFANTNTKKVWTLTGDRVIADSLEINNSAELVLQAASPFTVNVGEVLRLTSGKLNNSDPNANLKLADSVEISRATGEIMNPPQFGNSVDLKYTSSITSVLTGNEFPDANVVNNLIIYSTGQVVTLEKNAVINGNLTLSTGELDNNGSANDKNFVMGSGSTIRRASGTLSTAPNFAGTVNIEYISTLYHVTTDKEIPANQGTLNNLTLSGDQGITLGGDIYVNGTLTVEGSNIETGEFKAILRDGAQLTENPGNAVLGKVSVTRILQQGVNETFGGIGLEINAGGGAPGMTEAIRINNPRPAVFGGRRHYEINPANNSGLNATMRFFYNEDELGTLNENNLALYKAVDNGANWIKMGGIVDATNNNLVLSGINDFSFWAVNDKDTPVVGVKDNEMIPAEFRLSQNYPNPFNPRTIIEFTLSEEGMTELRIFNIIGQEVARLFSENGKAGQLFRVHFDASELPSGIYFARLMQGSRQMMKKMILIK
ncbi:MAG: T9SS type A sorting domain-containing protein [Ignavibacteriaceae bacterium]